MTSREQLAAELESVRKAQRTISTCVWGVAVIVMVYGIPIVYDLLTKHDVPGQIAWLLSIAADGALVVGLVATPVLARYNVPAGWIGTLRWVAGLTTWALQTAGPFTKPTGPDWLGVATHSAGPVLLFFVVEGAAYFQRRMGEVVSAKQLALTAAERTEADRRRQSADLAEQLRRVTAERAEALSRADHLAQQLETLTAENDSRTLTAEREIEGLRAATETLRSQHAERVSALTAKHREELARLRAETKTVSLTDYRQSHARKGAAPKGSEKQTRVTLSDEDAVQMLLEHNSDRAFEWSQAEARRVTGVGFGRIPRILSALSEHLSTCRSESHGECFGERRSEDSDDAEERAS